MRAVVLILIAAGTGTGCKSSSKKFDLREPHVEEFTRPPDEARYNNPLEKGYTPPPKQKEFRPGPGAMGGMNGMGGQ